MNQNCRIVDFNMNLEQTKALLASPANTAARTILDSLCSASEEIDPKDFAGALGPLLDLDAMGIYEDDIVHLYTDVCGQSIPRVLAFMRACQLGFCSDSEIKRSIAAVKNGQKPKPIEEIDALWDKVSKRIPFKKRV